MANLPTVSQIFAELPVPNNFVLIHKENSVFSIPSLLLSQITGFSSEGTEWASVSADIKTLIKNNTMISMHKGPAPAVLTLAILQFI